MYQAPASNASAIGALVCNIVAVLLCCNIVAIPGIITAAIAMGRVQTDPPSARKLTIWSWALFGVSVVAGIVFVVVYLYLVVNSESNYGGSSGI
ncbi:hypothetical protein [Actinomadura rubrisoli]|uniref:DUF4190 domain-containing protein n=1 Tax=Actinomadura rubrisoli TaxID=2530368 RepID=A0A4R5AE58_9ACTN|nr:hypothetical protein [Actinomadura rubrisoli]TDD70005.1 hypothetical protein E1298_36990 [Actinomadura rubrisoli]